MRWLLRIVAVVAVLSVALLVLGLVRPATHVASVRVELSEPTNLVWTAVSDFRAWPEWHPDVHGMAPQPDRNGREVWLMSAEWGELPLEVVSANPPRRLETWLDGGSFKGRWIYDLESTGRGTILTITEEGEVTNLFFRGMMAFMDEHASMRDFIVALGDHLGESVEPVNVR